MIKCSIYNANSDSVERTTCVLAEKCYTNGFRGLILTSSLELQEHINKLLWTYSKKHFIPHGSSLDSLPQQQPIYITNKLENPNQATTLILINPYLIQDDTTELNRRISYYSSFPKIIIIYTTDNAMIGITPQVIELLKEQIEISVTCYQQDTNSKWHTTTSTSLFP